MQEGYIFNDTIANNIAIGEDFIDKEKLAKAVEAAKYSRIHRGFTSWIQHKVRHGRCGNKQWAKNNGYS